MKKNTLSTLLLLLSSLIISTNAICEDKIEQFYQADLPRKAKKISYDKSGKIIELVKNSWTDRIKTDKGNVYYNYEQGYNYKKKQGFLKVYEMNGKLVEEKWDKNIDGAICQEEAMQAIEIFKKNKKVRKQFDSTDKLISIFTGFNFIDDKDCKPGSRCVHVFAHSGNVSVLAHSIVRLTDSSVPYPEFDMETTFAKQKSGAYKAQNKL